MNENAIQTSISLVAFRAVKVEFNCVDSPSEEQAKEVFTLDLKDLQFDNSPNHFSKVFIINLVTKSGIDNQIVDFKIEFHTVFECSDNIDDSFLDSEFVKISAPAIGFPFVRAFLSNITVQAGLPAIILPSINFVQFSKDNKD